jgi:hypothetical protein
MLIGKTGTVDPNREHTWTEIERHSRKEDLWIVVEGGVYDVTDVTLLPIAVPR